MRLINDALSEDGHSVRPLAQKGPVQEVLRQNITEVGKRAMLGWAKRTREVIVFLVQMTEYIFSQFGFIARVTSSSSIACTSIFVVFSWAGTT